jgi:hypothetical protein
MSAKSKRRIPLNAFEAYLETMEPEVRKELHDDLKKAMSTPLELDPNATQLVKDATATIGMTTAGGLTPYALEGPAYNVWPLVTPLRNEMPRRVVGGTGMNYKVITKIDSAEDLGFVAEMSNTNSGRAGFITWDEKNGNVVFKTIGLDNFISLQAELGARSSIDGANFNASQVAQLMSLHGIMMREEKAYLFANNVALTSAALGTPSRTYDGSAFGEPAIVQLATNVGSLTAATQYFVQVSALTGVGWRKGSTGNSSGLSGDDAIGETDPTAQATLTTAGGGSGGDKSSTFGWNAVKGSYAYNIFVGTVTGQCKYKATVTVNRYTILTSTATSTNVPNVNDKTADPNAFENIVKQIQQATASGSYYATLGGAGLTGDSTSGVKEFDDMFRSQFKNRQVSIDTLWMSADQRLEADKIITGSTQGPVFRIDLKAGETNIVGSVSSQGQWNRYMNKLVQFKTHPFLPPGTIFGTCGTLGQYYPAANLPNPIEMMLGFDYMRVEFAQTGLGRQSGTYFSGAPVLRVPFCLASIQCIG